MANLPDGTPLQFLWRPFPTDIVEQANRWANGTDPQPAVAISSMCLWHMLWSHNPAEFALILERMDQPIQHILSQVGALTGMGVWNRERKVEGTGEDELWIESVAVER